MGINTDILNGSSIKSKSPPYKIGIPRALYFFKFGALWKSFLEALGHTVVFSPPTSTKIVKLGTQVASSELCVPMKIYFGHVQELLNQYPDVVADQQAGRRNFPIVFGKRISNQVYGLFSFLAGSVLVLCVYLNYLPVISLVGFLSIGLVIPVYMAIMKYADDTVKLIPYLGINTMIAVLTPILISGTLIFT